MIWLSQLIVLYQYSNENEGHISKNALGYIKHRIEVVTWAKGNHLLVNLRTTSTCHYRNPGLHK